MPRWNRQENIRRYRRLLETDLTDTERQFIERRLDEELCASDSHRSASSAAGGAPSIAGPMALIEEQDPDPHHFARGDDSGTLPKGDLRTSAGVLELRRLD